MSCAEISTPPRSRTPPRSSKTPPPALRSSPPITRSHSSRTPSPKSTIDRSGTPSPTTTSNRSRTPSPTATSNRSGTPSPTTTSNRPRTPSPLSLSFVSNIPIDTSRTPSPTARTDRSLTPSPTPGTLTSSTPLPTSTTPDLTSSTPETALGTPLPTSRTPSPPSSPQMVCRQRRTSAPSTPKRAKLNVVEPSKSSPARDPQSYRQKQSNIKWIIDSEEPDLENLRQLAISRGGLLNDDIRKKAWPKLLNVDVDNIPPKPPIDVLHGHRDYQQVVLDVKRSLKRFPPGMEEMKRMSLQDQMVDVILRVLVEHDDLHYYQGYHDICVTFLLVVGEDLTFAIMDKLSEAHLRDFMYQTMEKTDGMLNYLYPIIGKSSPKLKEFMEKAEVGTIFCLSWLITWYGHTLGDFNHIVRLYDYFIACHPIMPIYLAAAIVLHRESEVLAAPPEMPVIHSLLSAIPDELPYELLMQTAGDLYVQFPPESLQTEIEEQLRNKKELEEALHQNRLKLKEMRLRREAMSKSRLSLIPGFHSDSSIFVKVTMWTLAAAFTAAAYSVFTSTTGWQLWSS